MRKIFSLLTAVILSVLSLNITIVQAENSSPITATAENRKYTWNFGVNDEGTASNIYDYSDEYADIRISLGTGDSITSADGIKWADPSCKEPPTSAKDSGRYIIVKPAYSGTLKLTIAFSGAGNSAKCRIWYSDFAETSFDEVDTALLIKGYNTNGAQIGSDITNNSANNLSFDVTAGHTYAIHTYNRGSKITALSYEADDIVGKTEKPAINEPITENDTSISGTCVEGAEVAVTINDDEPLSAEVSGTEWTLSGLTLTEGDTISVTAKSDDNKISDAATAVVLAGDNVSSITIAAMENGSVTTNLSDITKIKNGTSVTLTAVPNDGYKLSRLMIDGEAVETTDNQYTFTVEKSVTVSAEFEAKIYYDITLPTAQHGTVEISGGAENGKAMSGETVILDVRCEDGYRVKTLKYTLDGKTVNLKYSKEFVMPESSVEITAEFAPFAVVSNVDTSLSVNDRLTLNVDGEPFFYNGTQIRFDKAIPAWGLTDEQLQQFFTQAGKDGFTVVNTQIMWNDIQPNQTIESNTTGTLNAGSSETAFVDFALPEGDIDYAAAKIRLNVTEVSGTAVPHIYGLASSGDMRDAEDLGTTASWDVVNKANVNYDIDVTDFVNENSGTLHFAIGSDKNISCTASLVLSRDDVYDWTYLDKMIDYAANAGVKYEVLWFAIDTCQQSADSRVPYYVLNNYQKTLREDGTPIRQRGGSYGFLMCKNDKKLRAKEQEVLEAMFNHIAEYDKNHTVVGCQLTNEPATARMHEGDDKYNSRCHCEVCEEKYNIFKSTGKSDQDYYNDTMFYYENSLGEAIKYSDYSVWTRVNNYGGTDANLVAYNEKMRETTGTCIDFIGFDPYQDRTDKMYNFGVTLTQMTKTNINYSQGKNLTMIMENGGQYSDSAELNLAALAGGSFYNIYEYCGPEENQKFSVYMYNQTTKEITPRSETSIQAMRSTNAMLKKIAPHIASKRTDASGGTKLMFFNPLSDNTSSSQKKIRSIPIVYNTDNNSVGIAVEASDKEIVLESTKTAQFILKTANTYGVASVETGSYENGEWIKSGDKEYTEAGDDININMNAYDCVKVTLNSAVPVGEVAAYTYTYDSEKGIYTYDFSQVMPSKPLTEDITISNLKIHGTADDLINPNAAVYKDMNGNDTLDGGIWWGGRASGKNRYMEYTPENDGVLTLKLHNTYNMGSKTKSWLRYSTVLEGTPIGASEDLLSTDYLTMEVELEKGKTYYFWPVGGGVNISSFVYTTAPISDEELLTYNQDSNTVTSLLDGTLIIAQYTEGVLTKVTSKAVTSNESVELDFSGKCKIMLWDNLDSMKPLVNSPLEIDKTI